MPDNKTETETYTNPTAGIGKSFLKELSGISAAVTSEQLRLVEQARLGSHSADDGLWLGPSETTKKDSGKNIYYSSEVRPGWDPSNYDPTYYDSVVNPTPAAKEQQRQELERSIQQRAEKVSKSAVVQDIYTALLGDRESVSSRLFFGSVGALTQEERADKEAEFNKRYAKQMKLEYGVDNLRELINKKVSDKESDGEAARYIELLDGDFDPALIAKLVNDSDFDEGTILAPEAVEVISRLGPERLAQVHEEYQKIDPTLENLNKALQIREAKSGLTDGEVEAQKKLKDQGPINTRADIKGAKEVFDRLHWWQTVFTPEDDLLGDETDRSDSIGMGYFRQKFNGKSEEEIQSFVLEFDREYGSGKFYELAADYFNTEEFTELHDQTMKGYDPARISTSALAVKFEDMSLLYGLSDDQLHEVKSILDPEIKKQSIANFEAGLKELAEDNEVDAPSYEERQSQFKDRTLREVQSRYSSATAEPKEGRDEFLALLTQKESWTGLNLDAYNTWSPEIDRLAVASDINADAFRAMILQESRFDEHAASTITRRDKSGREYKDTVAVGLSQLVADAAEEMGLTVDRSSSPNPAIDERYDGYKNLQAGAEYLSSRMDMFDGHLGLGIAAYYAGQDVVKKALELYSEKKSGKSKDTWQDGLKQFLIEFNGKDPFKAAMTLDYVEAHRICCPNLIGNFDAKVHLGYVESKYRQIQDAKAEFAAGQSVVAKD